MEMSVNINPETHSEYKKGRIETLEETYARLEARKGRARFRRSKETPEERSARLEAEKLRARQRRSRETPEARAFRLESQKLRARRRRGTPTDKLETFDYMNQIINDSSSMSEVSFVTSLPFASEPTGVPPIQQVSSPTNSNTDLYNLQWSEFSNKFCGTFVSLLESQELVDVTIAAEGGYIQAHKLVLSVSSDYFRDLFKINPCKHPIVILKDIDYDLMNNLIQFMYCGEVKVAADKLPALLNTAEMLKIKGLIKENEQLQMEATTSDSTSHEIEPPDSSNIKIPLFKKPTIQTDIKQSHKKSMPSNIEIAILQEESQRSREKLTQRSTNVTLNTTRQCDPPPNKRTRYREPETVEENTFNVTKKITEIETTETLKFKSKHENNEDNFHKYEIQLIPNLIKKELECPNDYLDIYGNVQHNGFNTGPGYN